MVVVSAAPGGGMEVGVFLGRWHEGHEKLNMCGKGRKTSFSYLCDWL